MLGFYQNHIKHHIESISSSNMTNIIIREYRYIKPTFCTTELYYERLQDNMYLFTYNSYGL